MREPWLARPPVLAFTGPPLDLGRELVLWDRGSSACVVWSASSRVAMAGKEPAFFPRTTSEPHVDDVLCPWVLLACIRSHSTLFSDLRISNVAKTPGQTPDDARSALGAGVALLFAPQSGSRTRRQIRH